MKHLYPLILCLFLFISCSEESSVNPIPEAELEACFELSTASVSVGESIDITSCSKGAESYSYDFGNGENSTDANPDIAYSEDGEYIIELTITNEALDARKFSLTVQVTAAEANYHFPFVPEGFSAYPLETGINMADGSVYTIDLLTDNVGAGGSKFYYTELDDSFNVTTTYIADKPYTTNSAFVNVYPNGNKNFVFSRTLPGLYGTQEVTYDSGWGFVNYINSAVKHSYGYVKDGAEYLYFGTAENAGVYQTAIERRNASGDAYVEYLDDLGEAGSMIGDMLPVEGGYIAFGGVFAKNSSTPYISNYKPALLFIDNTLTITSYEVFEGSVLPDEISSAIDLSGSYHVGRLSNGNIAMYGNGELIVSDASGNLISSSFFEGTGNNQAMVVFEDSFILSSDQYLRKFNSNGTQVKEIKYNGKYMPEILEIGNTLFFVAGYETGGEIKMFYGSCDKDLNLISLDL